MFLQLVASPRPFDPLLFEADGAEALICIAGQQPGKRGLFAFFQIAKRSRVWFWLLYAQIVVPIQRRLIHHNRVDMVKITTELVEDGEPIAVQVAPIENRGGCKPRHFSEILYRITASMNGESTFYRRHGQHVYQILAYDNDIWPMRATI